MIGLGVMGRTLVLNLADHGFRVAMYDRAAGAAERIVAENSAASAGGLIACASTSDLLRALNRPRIIIGLVPAGAPGDAVCSDLIAHGIEPDDIVVDCGNSLFTDTTRREAEYCGRLTFFGSGISGGAEGARHGPSLMPGGDKRAWARLKPIWEAIAAKVDPRTGKELPHDTDRASLASGEPCAAYIGPGGAGHYVKMVHNGIEYADMQLIAEAFHLLRTGLAMQPREVAAVFRDWNSGELDSYLIEITAEVLDRDDKATGKPLVDIVLDAAGQKGTGAWSAMNAMEMGVPTPAIAEAVFARSISALKDERVRAATLIPPPSEGGGKGVGESPSAHSQLHPHLATASRLRRPSPPPQRGGGDRTGTAAQHVSAIHDALYCSKVCAYAQGFAQMEAASREHEWNLDLAAIARIWRGGCIIRARLLHQIAEAFERNPELANLLVDSYFVDANAKRQAGWREVVAMAVLEGIPAPAFGSSLAYFDSYRSPRLPADLIQAQRDFFGGHGFERIDQPRGKVFHIQHE